ncbi:MAG: hypothetical protein H6726_21305 [Sandaracinaceae bacterium]|nr:hypothetical protein [Sandaracinaceae bacterium]
MRATVRGEHQPLGLPGFDDLEADDAIRLLFSHAGRFPIMGSRYWDYDRVVIDFIPCPGGVEGQLLTLPEVDLELASPSFGAFLERYVEMLEAGDMIAVRSDVGTEIFTSDKSAHVGRVFMG